MGCERVTEAMERKGKLLKEQVEFEFVWVSSQRGRSYLTTPEQEKHVLFICTSQPAMSYK